MADVYINNTDQNNAHLICIKADGGVQIFSRTKGDIQQLSYPVTGSLNSIHTFCTAHSACLQSTTTDDARVVWKMYYNSITLILVSHDGDTGDWLFSQLLDLVFHSMVLMFGLDEVIDNLERLQQNIGACFFLVDTIMDFLNPRSISLLTLAADIISGPETVLLQTHLDGFTESAAGSSYGCLLLNGHVAVATKKWWELTAMELVLLQRLVNVLPKCQSRELVVFLPETYPKVAHRLLVFNLMPGVEVCVICGSTPSLSDVERKVESFWTMAVGSINSSLGNKFRRLPSIDSLDRNILGFLLINMESHRCLLVGDLNREHNEESDLNEYEQIQILISFYRSVVGSIFSSPSSSREIGKSNFIEDPLMICNASDRHPVNDTYICTEKHKLYAFQEKSHRFFLLFSNSIPSYATRSVSHKTLPILLKLKWNAL